MAKVIDPIVHDLLRDIRELASQQFIYEDPWHGYVPYDGPPTEYQIGPPLPFVALDRRDKADVLEWISWEHFREKGLDWRDQYAIQNNITEGKPQPKWLEGTSFLDPSLLAERREELIQETFELSREIGYAHFRAENFNRPDPALVRLGSEARQTFLREWWDGARERMYQSYREQVAGLSYEELARNREAYKEAMAADGGTGSSEKTPAPSSAERPGGKDDIIDTLRDQLFSAATPQPQPEHTHEPQHKR